MHCPQQFPYVKPAAAAGEARLPCHSPGCPLQPQFAVVASCGGWGARVVAGEARKNGGGGRPSPHQPCIMAIVAPQGCILPLRGTCTTAGRSPDRRRRSHERLGCAACRLGVVSARRSRVHKRGQGTSNCGACSATEYEAMLNAGRGRGSPQLSSLRAMAVHRPLPGTAHAGTPTAAPAPTTYSYSQMGMRWASFREGLQCSDGSDGCQNGFTGKGA